MRISKIALVALLLLQAGVFISMANGPSSSGAPAGHTGAPGEESCAAAGCHDDNAINAGTASVTLDAVENYIPGKTYPITVRVEDPNVLRFGFQIVAVSESGGNSLGKFIISDEQRTQLVSGGEKQPGRTYMTYTFYGTDASAPGKAEWTMKWKAPAAGSGPVRFYVGAVSANDNMNDKGDFVYVKNWLVNEGK